MPAVAEPDTELRPLGAEAIAPSQALPGGDTGTFGVAHRGCVARGSFVRVAVWAVVVVWFANGRTEEGRGAYSLGGRTS